MEAKRAPKVLVEIASGALRRAFYSIALSVTVSAAAVSANAQNTDTVGNTGATANTDVALTASPQSGSQSSSGGNVFDFSNSSGRAAPPGPNLPSFAGGPCMGVSGGVSASGPGFSLGGARSQEDEACQRRNWVQTLIGVSQHMPEVEANELKRVAITVMMQDEYLAPAFAALGYDVNNLTAPKAQQQQAVSQQNQRTTQREPTNRRAAQPVAGVMNPTCTTVVPANASPQFRQLVAARGCAIKLR